MEEIDSCSKACVDTHKNGSSPHQCRSFQYEIIPQHCSLFDVTDLSDGVHGSTSVHSDYYKLRDDCPKVKRAHSARALARKKPRRDSSDRSSRAFDDSFESESEEEEISEDSTVTDENTERSSPRRNGRRGQSDDSSENGSQEEETTEVSNKKKGPRKIYSRRNGRTRQLDDSPENNRREEETVEVSNEVRGKARRRLWPYKPVRVRPRRILPKRTGDGRPICKGTAALMERLTDHRVRNEGIRSKGMSETMCRETCKLNVVS